MAHVSGKPSPVYVERIEPMAAPGANFSQVGITNIAQVLTFPAHVGGRHVITGIVWSYSATPTAGSVSVQDGAGNYIMGWDITASGPGSIIFAQPLMGSANTAMIITLAAGGAGVQGKLAVHNHEVIG